MLVPVQYRRLLAHPRFDAHDLSAGEVAVARDDGGLSPPAGKDARG